MNRGSLKVFGTILGGKRYPRLGRKGKQREPFCLYPWRVKDHELGNLRFVIPLRFLGVYPTFEHLVKSRGLSLP
jgi:hypothetical protein